MRVRWLSPTTTIYVALALFLSTTVWGLVSLPFIASFINHWTGIDPLKLVGSGSVFGPNKVRAFEALSWGGVTLLVAAYLATLPHPGRMVRFAVLILVLPVVFSAKLWVDTTPYGAASTRIHIGTYPTVNYAAVFNDTNINRAELTSYDALYEAVEANFQVHADTLRTAWKSDGAELRALFYLNTVGRLFAYGNRDTSQPGGCAVMNEQSGFNPRDPVALGVSFYTQTAIGCCTDFATLMRFFLNGAGIDNRIIALPILGHFLNEVRIDGQWHTLDAQTGLYFDKSWDEIAAGSAPFTVIEFPVLSLDMTQPDSYRPRLKEFKSYLLMAAATGSEHADFSKTLDIQQ